MLKNIITMGILSLIIACQLEVKKKNDAGGGTERAEDTPFVEVKPEASPQITAPPSALAKPEMSYKGLNIFTYQAQVTWPTSYENVELRLNGVMVFKQETPSQRQSFVVLDHNKNYHIQMYAVRNDLLSADTNPESQKSIFELQQEWIFKTPLDLDLASQLGPSGLNQNLTIKAHRIFFGAGKIFQTNGYHLQLEADELFSDSSILRTFAKEQKAARDQLGKNGGYISIRARKAIGTLSIAMNGEAGGDGSNGEPYTERAASGGPGVDADSTCEYNDVGDNHRSFKYCYCVTQPEQGTPGSPGLPARPGQNGRKGGDSGKLVFEIAEPSPQFEIYFEANPGTAGAIGLAGAPQKGGLGGPPGHRDNLGECRKEVGPGIEGSPGDPAPNGAKESDGLKESECIAIGNGFGHCQK